MVAIVNNKPIVFNTKNSVLPNDNISNIFIDNTTIYISTLGGGISICKLNDDGTLKLLNSYTEDDGLQSNYV